MATTLRIWKLSSGWSDQFAEEVEADGSSDAQDRISALCNEVSEPDLREEHGSLKRALERYERVLGADGTMDFDAQALGKKLEALEKEKSHLQLRVEQAEAGTNALYTELEGVSKLWEGVEHTLRTKVFELKDAELKMSRLITEVSSRPETPLALLTWS